MIAAKEHSPGNDWDSLSHLRLVLWRDGLVRSPFRPCSGAEMSNSEHVIRERAAQYWSSGQPLEAGRLIFENLPTEVRPKWAASILRLVTNRSGASSEAFEQVLYDAEHQSMWADGHRAFDTLRQSTLRLEGRRGRLDDGEQLQISVLSLAELVAKVTYNAANPADPFDEDSGWWIAKILRDLVDHRWTDEAFSKEAWSALCFQQGAGSAPVVG